MEPVGLGVKVQQPFETIGNVMNIANTAQQMQRSNLALQTEDMVLRERKGVEQFLANPRNYMNERGEVDFPKLQSSVLSIAPTTGSQYIQHVTEATKAGTEARRALNTASYEERKQVAETAHSLIGQPAPVVEQQMKAITDQNPNLKPATDAFINYYVKPNASSQRGVDTALSMFGRGVQSINEQQAAVRGQYANTGGQLTQIDPTAKLAGQQPATLPLTLPLAEREAVSVHPVTNEYVTTKKDDAGKVTGVSPTPSQDVLRPKAGEKEAIAFNALTMGEDLKRNLTEGENAGRTISALQEIRKYAPGAVTGAFQEKRQLAQKIFSLLGLPYSDDVATNTDLLAKNSNMITSLTGGNTDLSRAITEAANPNSKMTEKSILRAVDQLLGQQQLKLARAHYLQQFARNPDAYGQAVTSFNRVADPRVFEYPNWSQEEKVKQKENMSESERRAFGEALRFFQSSGYIR